MRCARGNNDITLFFLLSSFFFFFSLLKPHSVTFFRFERIMNQSYVDDHEYLKWCPAPNCRFAIECHLTAPLKTVVPSVRCKCENYFCFG